MFPLVLVFLSLSTSLSVSFAQSGGVSFFVLGDWGREGKDSQTVVANSMGKRGDLSKPQFVISTGDNFYQKGVQSVTDSQWVTSFERIYSAGSLQIPWYAVLGNHDYLTNPEAEIAYTFTGHRWKMPARYFAQEIKVDANTTALFLFLDTSPFILDYQAQDAKFHVKSESTSRQLLWMDSVLSHSKAKWKFAVGHHPLYSAASTHGNTPELLSQVLPLFQRNNVQAYFCGHDHNLQHLIDDGIHYFVSGGGSRAREDIGKRADAVFTANSTGFLEVALTSTILVATFYDQSGKLLDTSRVQP